MPSGSTCPCIKQRHREYDRYSRDQRSRNFYGGKDWERARAAALDADGGIDVYLYMTEGIVVAADTVHHIIPIKDDWDKRINIDNMISLSSDTHSMIEQMYKKNKGAMIRRLQEMIKEYRGQKEDGGYLKSFEKTALTARPHFFAQNSELKQKSGRTKGGGPDGKTEKSCQYAVCTLDAKGKAEEKTAGT